jgi:alkanesulfonate monooxygenase SsuD/methylene tetrahydromethanopterin reductase-like flavin-dependent oxidoreductase (luciferase family)
VAEEVGFGELWFSEDCFFTGGLSGVTRLLDVTSRVPVGLGLASVMTRHPAVLAMELAGLARMHPGRLRAAVGLGNSHWLRQLGLLPAKPLTAVRETVGALRELLSGATVNRSGVHRYDDVRLDFVPERSPELWVGAVNERGLRLAGEVGDGVLLSVLTGPAYLEWAVKQVGDAPVTTYVLAAVDDDVAAARDAVREAVGFFLRAEAHTALVGQSAHGAEVRARLASGEPFVVEDRWIDEYAVAGPAELVAERLDALLAGGSRTVGLWLFPPDQASQQLRRLARATASASC